MTKIAKYNYFFHFNYTAKDAFKNKKTDDY